MAATNLNTVRSIIEKRLSTELATGNKIPVVFHNMSYTPPKNKSWCQCNVSFSGSTYEAMGGVNLITGLVLVNIYTAQGRGPGPNFTIGKRIRDLYNRIKVSGVYFDAPIGPEVMASANPEGYFQTQARCTFETFEEL